MATAASTALSTATMASSATTLRTRKSTTTTAAPKVKFLPGLNGYQGLKIHNNVVAMGSPVSTEQCFAKVVSSMRASGSTKKGGALSSTCNSAAEIFKIVLIMNGLTLVGVAVGFALLRIEASVEEAAE